MLWLNHIGWDKVCYSEKQRAAHKAHTPRARERKLGTGKLHVMVAFGSRYTPFMRSWPIIGMEWRGKPVPLAVALIPAVASLFTINTRVMPGMHMEQSSRSCSWVFPPCSVTAFHSVCHTHAPSLKFPT